ncbi:hypothetical protein EZL74_01975 [Flavobacterium silvisoli]|uniref:Uncharacterized protein n=1 Tax=Flavobacterium silvisoli TaxID=2529433 RepID=A0A4Q9ZAP3_9FLAO|nr:hypothetical protein [Flavobacterium silvisoli]TBX71299.1 hypothetical protein EZL74_01975 [Flavobacterium silvisoli]
MLFRTTFAEFYEKVKESLNEGTFAKLTFAKTIGNTDLMNIYIRPIVEDGILQLELKYKFQREEIVEFYSIDEAFERLLPFVNNPFLSVILFTTEYDLVYKLNKKRAVSIAEQPPTFAHASPALLEYLATRK